MKKLVLTFILLQAVIYYSQAQDTFFKGVVLDSLTKAPIAYVNIGFPGKSLGTVTNEKGYFSFTAPDTYKEEQLVLSHIGYEKKYLSGKELQALDTLLLKEKEASLREVVVQAKKLKVRKLGILTHSPFLWGTTQNRKGDIVELAQKINSSGKEFLLTNVHIYLRSVYGDSAVVRINFYKDTGSGPGERLVHRQLLEKRVISDGWQTFDLSQENILLKEDFYVSFEFLPLPNKPVVITTGGKIFRGDGYARTSSLGSWKKSGGAYSIYLEAAY